MPNSPEPHTSASGPLLAHDEDPDSRAALAAVAELVAAEDNNTRALIALGVAPDHIQDAFELQRLAVKEARRGASVAGGFAVSGTSALIAAVKALVDPAHDLRIDAMAPGGAAGVAVAFAGLLHNRRGAWRRLESSIERLAEAEVAADEAVHEATGLEEADLETRVDEMKAEVKALSRAELTRLGRGSDRSLA